jgi:hypothetical protein
MEFFRREPRSLAERLNDGGTVTIDTGNAPASEVRKLWLDLTPAQEDALDAASAHEYNEQRNRSPQERERQTQEMSAALTRAALRS